MIVLVLAIVALFGFAALAVDGGMVYSDRRHAQNAADASSLAGGGIIAINLENRSVTYGNFDCDDEEVEDSIDLGENAAVNRAQSNGFTIDADDSDGHGVSMACDEYFNGVYTEKFIDVHTQISDTTPTSFAHLIYSGELRNQVDAVTRVRPRGAIALGYSVVSLNDEEECNGNQNGLIISGNGEVNIHGGGIFTNGCLSGNGNSLDVDVDDGGTIVHGGDLETNHINTFNPAPIDGDGVTLPDWSLGYPAPDCSQVPNFGSPSQAYKNNASGHIPDGNYSAIKMNGDVTLEAGGLYCLYGNFSASSHDLTIDESNGKNGVTIYMINGDFTSNGSGYVILEAPLPNPDPSPAIPGLLFYMPASNDGEIEMGGSTGSEFTGTVFAPGGLIRMHGNPDNTYKAQLIGWDVELDGGVFLDVTFDEDRTYQLPSNLELYK